MSENHYKPWTKDEERILIENWINYSDNELTELLSDRTSSAIKKKRRGLKLYRDLDRVGKNCQIWDESEDKKLKAIFNLYTDEELAELFNRTESSIACRRVRLGLLRVIKEEIPEGFKKCPECLNVKPLEEFNKLNIPRSKTKREGRCRECKNHLRRIKAAEKKILQEQMDKIEKKEKYIRDRKDTKFFCKICNEEKTIYDYDIELSSKGYIQKSCKVCKKRRTYDSLLKRVVKEGY